jgi:hypothetical protein
MKVTWQEKEFNLNLDDIDVQQAKVIKVHCQQTLLGIQEGLSVGDPDSLRAVYWLMHAQSGTPLDIDRCNFKIVPFLQAVQDAAEADKPADEDNPKEDETVAAE